MLIQLLICSIVMGLTVFVHAEMLSLFKFTSDRINDAIVRILGLRGRSLLMAFAALWILAAMTLEVWLWAIVLLLVGAFQALEPALYFALVCFTTLGFGDVILGVEWRIMSALLAINGLLLFGWSTAFMVDILRTER